MKTISESKRTTLSVVIPAYNEEDGIADIIERVLAVKPALAAVNVPGLELIVVDDGSSDRTADIVRGYADVILLQHNPNRGYGAALKTGWAAAKGELLAFLDADGTYPPEHFPELCTKALAGADIVVGSRRSGASSGMPLTRKLGNFIWSNLITFLAPNPVIDPASGMRVFKKEILEKIYPLPDGLNLTPIMSTRAVHEGLSLVETPIPYEERVGRSKLSVVRDGTLFLQSIVWTILTYNPARVLGILGLLGIAFALLVALGLTIARFTGTTTLSPLGVAALYSALVSGVGGVSIFSLGITFNYLISLFTGTPVRYGVLSKPLFKNPLDRQFGWMGLASMVAGLVAGLTSFILGLNGWEMTRLWFWGLASAMALLVGVQLVVSWVLLRVLEELGERETRVQKDLGASE